MPPLKKIRLIAISMGDPAGIGPEVILKAAAQLARRRGEPMLAVIGDIGAMRETARRLGAEVPEPHGWSFGDKPPKTANGLAVIDAGGGRARPGGRLGPKFPEPHGWSLGDRPPKPANGLAVITAGKLSS